MSRIALTKIPSITFYKDEPTLSRRGNPIPQLMCIGKPCKLYQPEVVRCTNLGGAGTDVDWKCEADLPESLRFGKVEVSCEGWDGPGDSSVLKGSCALEYRLVQIPSGLRREDHSYPTRWSRWLKGLSEDPTSLIFMLLWVFVLGLILYSALKSCFGSSSRSNNRPTPRDPPPRRPYLGWSAGGTGGGRPDTHDAPPPYSKHPPSSQTNANDGSWRPGFWTGAALGGLGTYMMNRQTRDRAREMYGGPSAGMYDWEAERRFRPARASPAPASPSSWWGGGASRRYGSDDRGEGPSDLGRMRRSTGLGGSHVR